MAAARILMIDGYLDGLLMTDRPIMLQNTHDSWILGRRCDKVYEVTSSKRDTGINRKVRNRLEIDRKST